MLYTGSMISKKEQIIEAARIILIREGSSQFSMRKVADEASMSLGNLQYYFKTKSDLIQGLLKNYIEICKADFEDFFDMGNKGREGLLLFIQAILIDELNDADDQFFISLFSFAEQKQMETPLKFFYEELFSLLGQTLEKIVDLPCSSESIQRACALLLPYFEGFGSVGTYLKLDSDEMAGILSDAVWNTLIG